MEIMAFSTRRRSGYNRSSPKNRRSLKVARLGAEKRSWRLRLAPKLRLASPVKLWYKMKSVYTNMMLKLATNSGSSNSNNVFGAKRINPESGDGKMEYSRTEFENRLVFEIYKSISSSLELGYSK
ncbi:hypothetical protein ACS0TY_029093 [Phlomoides rotata]